MFLRGKKEQCKKANKRSGNAWLKKIVKIRGSHGKPVNRDWAKMKIVPAGANYKCRGSGIRPTLIICTLFKFCRAHQDVDAPKALSHGLRRGHYRGAVDEIQHYPRGLGGGRGGGEYAMSKQTEDGGGDENRLATKRCWPCPKKMRDELVTMWWAWKIARIIKYILIRVKQPEICLKQSERKGAPEK